MNEVSLSERIVAPDLTPPAAVTGIEWRALTLTDVDALVSVNKAIAAADHPDWVDSREEVLEELGHTFIDLALDSIAAVDKHGGLVAWGLVICPPTQETLVRSILVGGVAPEHRGRGIGRALLAWQHTRALRQLAGSRKSLPGWVVVSVDERAPSGRRIVESFGFTAQRYFQNLVRSTAHPIPEAALGDGIRVVAYSEQFSAATHAARDEAFRGHGSSQPMSDEMWKSMMSMSTFAPQFSFIALDRDDRVVGLLLTLVEREDPSGYIWVVGVVPSRRGRGIARSMFVEHLLALRRDGIGRSALDVAMDAPNEGLELYTGLGYAQHSLSVNYVRVY